MNCIEIFSATSIKPFIGIESVNIFMTRKTTFSALALRWLLIEIVSGLTFNL